MNKVLLIGRLTKNIELSKTQNGKAYARFILAVNRRFKSNDPNSQDADFINCVVWDKRAETMYQYISKGSQIGVEGRIQTGSYEKDGQRIYTSDVIVENFDFLESRSQRQQSDSNISPLQKAIDKDKGQSFDEDPVLDIGSEDLPF